MSTVWNRLAEQWRDSVNLVLGIWIVVSPWLFGFASEQTAAWNAYVVGVIIAIAAFAALVNFQKWEEWVNAALGAWLIVSPWILGVAALSGLAWNQAIVGLLIGALAVWSAVGGSEQFARQH